jgi:hypothetical protein
LSAVLRPGHEQARGLLRLDDRQMAGTAPLDDLSSEGNGALVAALFLFLGLHTRAAVNNHSKGAAAEKFLRECRRSQGEDQRSEGRQLHQQEPDVGPQEDERAARLLRLLTPEPQGRDRQTLLAPPQEIQRRDHTGQP